MSKIGFSLSRCVVDIIEGRVNYDDVEVIIARTNFDPTKKSHLDSIWKGYTQPNWWNSTAPWARLKDKEKEVKELVIKLHTEGKLHQPRQTGNWPERSEQVWREIV